MKMRSTKGLLQNWKKYFSLKVLFLQEANENKGNKLLRQTLQVSTFNTRPHTMFDQLWLEDSTFYVLETERSSELSSKSYLTDSSQLHYVESP